MRNFPSKKYTLNPLIYIIFFSVVVRVSFLVLTLEAPVFEKYVNLAQNFKIQQSCPFFSSPGYTFFIALFGFAKGNVRFIVKLAQIFIGTWNVIICFLIAKELFNVKTAYIASLIACFTKAFILYESDLITATIMIFASLLSMYLFIKFLSSLQIVWLVFSAVFLGVSVIIRPNAVVLIFIMIIMIWFVPGTKKSKIIRSIFFLFFSLLIVTPVTILNYYRTGEFILVTASGGSVFYSSNNYRATGLGYSPPPSLTIIENKLQLHMQSSQPVEHQIFKYLADRANGSVLTYREMSKFYFNQGLQFLKKDIPDSLILSLKKTFYLFNNYEVCDTASLVYRKKILDNKMPFLISSALIVAFAFLGFVMHKNRFVLLVVIMYSLPHLLTGILFYVNGRLRVPLIAIMIPFAASGVYLCFESVKQKKGWSWMHLLVLMAVLGVTTPQDSNIKWHREIKTDAFFNNIRGIAALKSGNFQIAEKFFMNSVNIDPLGNPEAYENLSIIYALKNLDSKTEAFKKKANGIWTPSQLANLRLPYKEEIVQYKSAWGTAFWRDGQKTRAYEIFREIHEKYPRHPDPAFNLAIMILEQNPDNIQQSIKFIQEALSLNMKLSLESTRAYHLLLNLLERTEKTAEKELIIKQIDWEKNLPLPTLE